MEPKFNLIPSKSLLVALCAMAIVSCAKVITSEPQRPVLPETAPDYRTEMAPIFEVQTGIEEGPNLNERAQLGRVLFHDRMLSQNGAVSCNSCHHQSHGFAEPRALSSGLRQELTERNASHLANPGAQFAYFWDGRANDLTTQVTMPVENHVEMGFRSLDDLVLRLEQLDYYSGLFEAAYGQPEPTIDHIQDALSTFLRCLVSCRSKADDAFAEAMPDVWNPWGVLQGDIALTGLNDLERQGFELFHGKAQCANCHGGPHFNGWGLDFADIGLDANTEAGALTPIDAGGGFFGGWGPTAMKVPSLRNVALTAPYMHDGRFATLDEVIDHYSHGIQDVPTLDPRLRDWNTGVVTGGPDLIDPIIFPGGTTVENVPPVRLNFTAQERLALKAFLNSLTDYAFVEDPRFSNPFTTP